MVADSRITGKSMFDKNSKIAELKQIVLDIMSHYDCNVIQIEISVYKDKRSVTISIKEVNV